MSEPDDSQTLDQTLAEAVVGGHVNRAMGTAAQRIAGGGGWGSRPERDPSPWSGS